MRKTMINLLMLMLSIAGASLSWAIISGQRTIVFDVQGRKLVLVDGAPVNPFVFIGGALCCIAAIFYAYQAFRLLLRRAVCK
jgi:hypothetical protein